MKSVDWVTDLIRSKVSERFYGIVTLHFNNGKIIHAKEEKSLKPPENSERNAA